MAERMKDNEDLALEALFASEPLADDGFSRKVMQRLRRRLWVRRLALPTAVVAGLAIAAKPATEMVGAFSGLTGLLPEGLLAQATSQIPQLSSMVLTGVVMVVAMVLMPAFDD